ncbi:hypothetical protein [Nocardioides hwasunensis]|uniref:Uncharacterized protein n=1 Tax=Nocardioides hwasunensis TaxID=397258 RepID=A0ABR8MET4_9ACTN|nr:hypothetical protein [Nocardioides hwasunensis]MBD3913170.1 hypothetical protein [Nocardioides hwasunensis]
MRRMPVLSLVYPWPAQHRADRPTDDDPVVDVAIRACRSVAALYSEALREVAIPHRTTELRLVTARTEQRDGVHGSVHVDPLSEGWESGTVFVPESFVDHTPRARAEALLEVVHGMVLRLGEARGWDASLLEKCRQHVVDRDLEHRWTAPAKTSPGRRHEARAEFRMMPDGYGRARLVIVRTLDGAEVATSGEALAYCTPQGFLRAAKTLRWHGKDRVAMTPYGSAPAWSGGEVSLTRSGDAWTSTVVDRYDVRPVPGGDPTLAPLEVSVVGRGETADEAPPRATFVGGGPIQTPTIRRFHEVFSQDMGRIQSPAGQSWWSEAGLRVLEVQVAYQASRTRVRGRVTGRRLGVFVDVADETLDERDHVQLSRQLTEDVIGLARRRTGLGEHPELAPD